MPIPHIGDYREKKKKSHADWYIIAGVLGVVIFLLLLLSFKAIAFIIKFAVNNLVYFGIGVLILLFLIRKIKKHKRKKEMEKREDLYR